MYGYINRLRNLYSCLEDDLSKKVFLARMECDVDPSAENWKHLTSLRSGYTEENAAFSRKRLNQLLDWARSHQELIIYGTGLSGQKLCSILLEHGIAVYGFCGRRAVAFSESGLMGKPVVSPVWLGEHADRYFVIVASTFLYNEIFETLKSLRVPAENVFSLPFDSENFFLPKMMKDQYFEFPQAFSEGTAFVDAGCLNGDTSITFAEWCGNKYSKVFAFEPDPASFAECQRQLSKAGIHDVELVQAGLANQTGCAKFADGLKGGSHLIDQAKCAGQTGMDGGIEVRTVRLDDVVGGTKVGFIKMDIEGAEYDALHGACRILERDKPLLAICVYHKPGDILAIMEYLREIVPSYHFALRQYGFEYGLGICNGETVLYAYV